MPGASLQGRDFVHVTFTTVGRHQLATASRVWRKVHPPHFRICWSLRTLYQWCHGHCAGLTCNQCLAVGLDAEHRENEVHHTVVLMHRVAYSVTISWLLLACGTAFNVVNNAMGCRGGNHGTHGI